MDNQPIQESSQKGEYSSSSRLLILQGLVPIATNLVSSQLEAFSARLTEALFQLSEQPLRPEEATQSFQAYQLLKRNSTAFYRLVAGQVNADLAKEVSIVNTKKRPKKTDEKQDFSLVSFDEMENKVLLGNLSQALEVKSAEQLVALNMRIGHIFRRTPISVAQNPFRPEVFINAVYHAWMEFDSTPESHRLVLRLLQPETFLQLTPILDELNRALVERGILPDLADAYRAKQKRNDWAGESGANLAVQDKLRSIFSPQPAQGSAAEGSAYHPGGVSGYGGSNMAGSAAGAQWAGGPVGAVATMGPGGTVTIDRQFFEYLTNMQRTAVMMDVAARAFDTSALRQLSSNAAAQSLTPVDQSTIDLLTRIFDYVFSDPAIPGDLKGLIGQLQIPTLKAALLDKDFFFKETHPARVLIDTLAKSSVLLDAKSTTEDPLYQMMEGIVERVQQDFDQQIDLFSDVVADLESFLKEEEQKSEQEISQSIADALHQEKMRLAREFAENDVAIRVETGEVAGFLETFLKEQWLRILTIAHSVKEQKPHALENALRTMDDLIWSLKPKNSAEERKELVSKLPAMLTLLNAWLNAIKWDEPERVLFFSRLAERHAAIARAPLEFSPRRQLEIAVNIAQRASDRRFSRHMQDQMDQTMDEWMHLVESLERGIWVDFAKPDGNPARFKLAWVSPKRTRYIFTNRQGHDAFSISGEELVAKFREGVASKVAVDAVVDRALAAALQDMPEGQSGAAAA
jgi:hypothetical protein